MGQDSPVGITNRYGLEVRGSNSYGSKIFRTRPDLPGADPSLLYNGYRVLPGGKAAGAWHLPPTPSSADVKEGVDLYLYSTSGPFVACYSVNFNV